MTQASTGCMGRAPRGEASPAASRSASPAAKAGVVRLLDPNPHLAGLAVEAPVPLRCGHSLLHEAWVGLAIHVGQQRLRQGRCVVGGGGTAWQAVGRAWAGATQQGQHVNCRAGCRRTEPVPHPRRSGGRSATVAAAAAGCSRAAEAGVGAHAASNTRMPLVKLTLGPAASMRRKLGQPVCAVAASTQHTFAASHPWSRTLRTRQWRCRR